jgi:hypothetical protein
VCRILDRATFAFAEAAGSAFLPSHGHTPAATLLALVFAAGCKCAPLPSVSRQLATTVYPGADTGAATMTGGAFQLRSPGAGGGGRWAGSPPSPRSASNTWPQAEGNDGDALRAQTPAKHLWEARQRTAYVSARLEPFLEAIAGSTATPLSVLLPVLGILLRPADPNDNLGGVMSTSPTVPSAPAAVARSMVSALPRDGEVTPTNEMPLTAVRVTALHRAPFVLLPPGSNDDTAVLAPGRLIVDSCDDAYISVLRATSSVLLSNLRRCTVVLGPATTCVAVDACQQCQIVLAAGAVTISNSADCSLYVHTPTQPVFLGDCRGNKLGPYAARYSRLADQLQALRWYRASSPATSASEPWALPVHFSLTETDIALVARIMDPSDFIVMDADGSEDSNTTLLSGQYAVLAAGRMAAAVHLREDIENGDFTFMQQRELQSAIQTAFLVSGHPCT